MKLHVVIAEAALELVPEEVRSHPAVRADARRRGEETSGILLDRSFHHSAMLRLSDAEKRGRPDLVHAALLSVAGTPLYLDGRVKVFVHCHGGAVFELEEKTRIPKSYFRFRGLMEKVLGEGAREGLVRRREGGLKGVLGEVRPQRVWGLTVLGKARKLSEVSEEMASVERPLALVGGFPHGHFSREVSGVADEFVRIDKRPLEAHVVLARVVYEVEKASEGFND